MESRKNDDFWGIVCTLAAVAFVFYSFAHWIAGAMNLDLRSASFILAGGLLAIAMFACVLYFGLNIRALAPLIVVLVAPSLAPALQYWALEGPGPFHMRYTEDMAWFGNNWRQFVMLLVLVVGAYGCNKLTGDWFRD